jgi:hypothetical protein
MKVRFLLILAAFSGVLFVTAGAEEKERPRPQTFRGMLTKVEATSITVTSKGDSGERSEIIGLTNTTKIVLESKEDEKIKVKGEGGNREITRAKRVEGKLADLKVNQRVTVSVLDKKAIEILVLREPQRKKEGDR